MKGTWLKKWMGSDAKGLGRLDHGSESEMLQGYSGEEQLQPLRLERGKQRSCQFPGSRCGRSCMERVPVGGHFSMSHTRGRSMVGFTFHILPLPSQVMMLPAWLLKVPDSDSGLWSGVVSSSISSSICSSTGSSLVVIRFGFLHTELFILPNILKEIGVVYMTSSLKFNHLDLNSWPSSEILP